MFLFRVELEKLFCFDFIWKKHHQRCSVKKGVLRNFPKFTGKCEFCEISKSTFFTKHLRTTASRVVSSLEYLHAKISNKRADKTTQRYKSIAIARELFFSINISKKARFFADNQQLLNFLWQTCNSF